MIVITAVFRAKEGKEEELEALLRDFVPRVAGEEGTLAYALHRSQSDPRAFLFYEKYTDGDALGRHSTTPHFKTLSKAMAPLIEGRPVIEMYAELASI